MKLTYVSTRAVCEEHKILKQNSILKVCRFYTHFLSSILLMLWLLILVSGKNSEYSQAAGKSCKRKLPL